MNPTASVKIVAGSSLITLGTRDQLDRLKQFLDHFEQDSPVAST